MRRITIFLAVAGFLLVMGTARAADVFLGTSKRSFEKLPIWIVPFATESKTPLSQKKEAPGESPEAVAPHLLAESVVYADLARSQLFRLVDLAIPKEDRPINLAQGPSKALTAFAKDAGALVMAWAKVYPANGKWAMEAYAYETRSENPVIRVKITGNTARVLAHRFADKLVYQFTGESGIAQTRILYQSERNGRNGIYIMDYDGENERRILSEKAMLLPPRWSHDATHIGYTVYSKGQSSIYFLELATALQKRVFFSERLSFPPVWSESGDGVAFASTKDGNGNIYIMRPNGEGVKQLTFHRAADVSPTWSPTGQEIAFTSDRGGTPQIYIMDREGVDIRRLTFVGNYNSSASWSPRGDWIAYTCRNSRDFMKLCAYSVNGQKRIEITTDGAWDDESPSWAPNGREIIFTSNRSGKKQLFSIRPDGTGLISLTANMWEKTNPVWSPR